LPLSATEAAWPQVRQPPHLGPLRPVRSIYRRYLGSRSSASRREGNMGWPSHPVAICTTCGAPIEDPRFINERCTRGVGGRRCSGTYGITMSPRDWKRCGRSPCGRGRTRHRLTPLVSIFPRPDPDPAGGVPDPIERVVERTNPVHLHGHRAHGRECRLEGGHLDRPASLVRDVHERDEVRWVSRPP